MITKVKLLRFKKFKNNEVLLKPFTVMMGENSCGKTTVIQAINLSLNTFAKSGLITLKGGKATPKVKGIGATTLPGINIADFRELYYGKISRQSRKSNRTFGAIIELTDDKKNIYKLQVSSLFGGFNLKCLSTANDLENAPTIYDFTPLLISGFVGLQETEQRSFPVNIRQHLSSGNVSAVIRNLVLDLKKNNIENYNKLRDRLVDDFSFYLDDVEFNEQKDMFVKAAYSEKFEDEKITFDFNSSGSGFMQVLQILAPIYTVCPDDCKVVLLDEPDAHLHPNMQIALAKSLQKIQKELGIQIIISTHSAAIIKSVRPSSVVPISTNNLICKPLSVEEEVEESIAQLDNYELAKSVISGKMVFIEDANIEVWETIDKILGTKVFYGANTVSIHKGRSKDDKMPFQIKPLLKDFLNKDIEIIFIRDSDGLSDEWRQKLIEYGEKKEVKLYLLEKYEVENYILNGELIHRALCKKFPGYNIPTVEQIENKIYEFLKNTIIMSRYKYDDNLEDSIFKASLILNLHQYRNNNEVKSEAERIRRSYEEIIDGEAYKKVGMGKETLKQIFYWLNNEIKLNLNKEDILEAMEERDVSVEMENILKTLRSNILDEENLGELEECEDEIQIVDEEDSVDEILQLTLPLERE
ncbi:ATP-binding protein [Anaerovorax odorimutans]|uniref:ATP-binding protein n=1 Tax=Anaerovorax odorimutans TaxID=109327 RepID=A0ABT1RLT0_9FIRM|nr:ATP-binding protein [Anaerovorax odorimutans]MCQ4636120.1 ATP-binding protein [Anaerovorax odorimutans]